jgi:ubiquinone/menaquinone biosynthesis C-methylase UbiE
MAGELTFKDEAAAEYDRAFAHVTAHFMPFLLRAAHIAPGMHVLDIATGTGLSAEAALDAGSTSPSSFSRACWSGDSSKPVVPGCCA